MHSAFLNRLVDARLELDIDDSEFVLLCAVCDLPYTLEPQRKEIRQNINNVKKIEKRLLKKFDAPDLLSVVVMLANCYKKGGHYKGYKKASLADIMRQRKELRDGRLKSRGTRNFSNVLCRGQTVDEKVILSCIKNNTF